MCMETQDLICLSKIIPPGESAPRKWGLGAKVRKMTAGGGMGSKRKLSINGRSKRNMIFRPEEQRLMDERSRNHKEMRVASGGREETVRCGVGNAGGRGRARALLLQTGFNCYHFM